MKQRYFVSYEVEVLIQVIIA